MADVNLTTPALPTDKIPIIKKQPQQALNRKEEKNKKKKKPYLIAHPDEVEISGLEEPVDVNLAPRVKSDKEVGENVDVRV